MKYIATLSGGKDSTVMCDLLLKNNYPVDYIVFSDTLDEFDEMYSYIDKLDEYFKSRYNKTITRLEPKKLMMILYLKLEPMEREWESLQDCQRQGVLFANGGEMLRLHRLKSGQNNLNIIKYI